MVSLVWAASCGSRCSSAISAVPSFVAAEREGWV